MSAPTLARTPGAAQDPFTVRSRAWRRRRWQRRGLAVLALSLVAALVWTLGWSRLVTVQTIDLSGGTKAQRASARAAVADQLNRPMARVDPDTLAATVRDADVSIAEAGVTRRWPSTVAVVIVPRVAALSVARSDGSVDLVDPTGVVFASAARAPKGLPHVRVDGPQGSTPGALSAALMVLNSLPDDVAAKVTGITVTSANLVTLKMGSKTIVWGGRDAPARKAAIVRALLRTGAGVIDVSAPDTPVTR